MLSLLVTVKNMNKYNPKEIENKLIKDWSEKNIYKTGNQNKEKFYSLYSFPYPSGAGLHVGHVVGMVANDIFARYWRMKGRDVLFPMGWDSFGLPAENFAIKTGTPPKETTEKSISSFKDQITRLGISVDWESEVGAHRQNYYKWTQWIFLQLYKKGLAYRKKAPVNWCPKDQTVLANEQVINGKCERCDTEVFQKEMEQWFFKITEYADRLDSDLEKINWPLGTKAQQRNWIGKSVGAEIFWKVKDSNITINTFTTRFDTIPGATFIVLAHGYPDLNKIVKDEFREEVEKYVNESKNKTDLERQSEKIKSGVFTGSYAVNPFNQDLIPIYVANYVLAGYGTGAVMGMPGHDKRDFEFAKNFNLPIKYTLNPENETIKEGEPYEGEGFQINSNEFNGLFWSDARDKIFEKLKEEGKAKESIHYRLRDWLISRQRYWGCPIPIVYDPEGNPHPIDEKFLPLTLPEDVDFLPTGESPIKRSEEFKKRAEKIYGKGWTFESDTMDTFVDSSWYFLRHIDANNSESIFDKDIINRWMPVDLYLIGTEHTVLHLLYSRFFTKFLYDQGYINFDEPFIFMRHMGLILGPDGRKMSKRWGNIINPNDEIEKFSADTIRLYEMFMGPFEDSKPWSSTAENGVFRFLNKIWYLNLKVVDGIELGIQNKKINILIKEVERDTLKLSFNTVVAKFMEFSNFLIKEDRISKKVWEKYLKIMAPYIPFITDELWRSMGNENSIHLEEYPVYEKEEIKELIKLAVQVNGKVRGFIEVQNDTEQSEVVKIALSNDKITRHLSGEIKKVIFVKNRILNLIS